MKKNNTQNKIASNGMKKLIPKILILIVILFLFTPIIKIIAQEVQCTYQQGSEGKLVTSPISSAQECRKLRGGIVVPTPTAITCTPPLILSGGECIDAPKYIFLAPLSDEKTFDPSAPNAFGDYLNKMIIIIIGLCVVMAVIMITLGGMQYMTTELISGKEAGKERIRNALLGLLLVLGAYTILYTINPALLNTSLSSVDTVTVQVSLDDLGGESSAPFQPINKTKLQTLGITCPENGSASLYAISATFINRSTYSQTARNTSDGKTAYLDCSSFVAQVYACAGLTKPGNNTREIFAGAETIPIDGISADGTKVNGKELKVGDLLGWPQPGAKAPPSGHVVMYRGSGYVIDAQGSTTKENTLNGAVKTRPLTYFKDKIKFIKRAP